jgi:CheY-like chemotaxis protein
MAPLSGLADPPGSVLAIDDDEDALTLLRVVLETAGAEVVTVNSPLAALERIETARANVLVVDLGMPVMDGFELISRVRASSNPEVRDVPAAALTAFARSEDRTKALRSGFEMTGQARRSGRTGGVGGHARAARTTERLGALTSS